MAVDTRTVTEIATNTNGSDLEAEFEQATAALTTDPVLTTLHTFATLAGIAIARVRILELER